MGKIYWRFYRLHGLSLSALSAFAIRIGMFDLAWSLKTVSFCTIIQFAAKRMRRCAERNQRNSFEKPHSLWPNRTYLRQQPENLSQFKLNFQLQLSKCSYFQNSFAFRFKDFTNSSYIFPLFAKIFYFLSSSPISNKLQTLLFVKVNKCSDSISSKRYVRV